MTNNPKIFSAQMTAACERAIKMGVFYEDHFAATVLDLMGGFDCEPQLIAVHTIPLNFTHPQRRDLLLEVDATVNAAPRGHYVLLHEHLERGETYRIVASDGSGTISTGGAYDRYDAPPSGEKVLSRMIGYEIYLCRSQLEKQRRTTADMDALRKHRFKPGQNFNDIRLPGDAVIYSTAAVESVDPITGQITLVLTRRGTRSRIEVSIGAATLESMLAEEVQSAAAFVTPGDGARQTALF